MKLLFLCTVLILFKHVHPFFGFNVVYPTYARVSSECIKAASSLANLPNKLEQISKISSKFSSSEFDALTQSLMDLKFFFNGMHIFLQQFSNLINEPSTSDPLKVINLLQYNAMLMESATTQISGASKNFGILFGENMEIAVDLLISKHAEQVKIIRISMETLHDNFESILHSGSNVTLEILDNEIDGQATADILVAFQEISVASKQMTSISSGIVSILQILNSMASKVTDAGYTAQSTITLLKYSLNLETKSAKIRFSEHIKLNIDEIIQSFGDYSQASHKVFFNVSSQTFQNTLHDQQKILDDFASQISEMLWQTQNKFSKRLQAYYDSLHKSFQIGQVSLNSAVTELKKYLGQLIVQNGGTSFKKCFSEPNELVHMTTKLITELETGFTECVNQERTLSLQAESLLKFIIEDITLNIQGAFDQLCKCSVRGGSKILEQSKECIEEITTNLSTISFKEDKKYLDVEMNEASSTLQNSELRFETCIEELGKVYKGAFVKFQQASLTCLVS